MTCRIRAALGFHPNHRETTRCPRLQPRIHEVPDDLLAAIDYCYDQGWTDGLPVVPPRSIACTRCWLPTTAGRDRHRQASRDRPRALPARRRRQRRHGGLPAGVFSRCWSRPSRPWTASRTSTSTARPASTGGSAPLLVVSGPIADEIGMNADVNLFGPGNRPNATIGRPMRLILRNVFQMLPGISDKSTQGNPGKYSLCIAERMPRQPVAAALPGAGLRPRASPASPSMPPAASAMSRTTAATRPSRSWARWPTPWPTMAASRWARAW